MKPYSFIYKLIFFSCLTGIYAAEEQASEEQKEAVEGRLSRPILLHLQDENWLTRFKAGQECIGLVEKIEDPRVLKSLRMIMKPFVKDQHIPGMRGIAATMFGKLAEKQQDLQERRLMLDDLLILLEDMDSCVSRTAREAMLIFCSTARRGERNLIRTDTQKVVNEHRDSSEENSHRVRRAGAEVLTILAEQSNSPKELSLIHAALLPFTINGNILVCTPACEGLKVIYGKVGTNRRLLMQRSAASFLRDKRCVCLSSLRLLGIQVPSS